MTICDEIISMIEKAKITSASVLKTSNLYKDMGFDSLQFVQLLLEIEETYSIIFGLAEMEMCIQVGRLIALVESKVKGFDHDSTLIDESEEHK